MGEEKEVQRMEAMGSRVKNEMELKADKKGGRKGRGPRNSMKGWNKLVTPPKEGAMLRGLLIASDTFYSTPLIVLSHSH